MIASSAQGTSVLFGETTISYASDDGTVDLDAHRLDFKNDTSRVKLNTGLNTDNDNTGEQNVFYAILNTVDNDVWLFSRDSGDLDDIYLVNSTDDGVTYSTPLLWRNEASGSDEIKLFSGGFDNATCNMVVTWLNGSSSPFTIIVDNLTVGGSCAGVGDTCDCAGLNNDWEIDHSDSCDITEGCDLGTGTLSFTGTGTTQCSAHVNTTNLGDPGDGGTLQINNACVINVD